MSQVTVNPYGLLASQYTTGLNAIIASLPATPTIDDVVTAVYNYVQPIYYPGSTVSPQVQTEIQSIAYHAVNSYVNNLIAKGNAIFTPNQLIIAGLLIGPDVSQNLPIYLTDWISDVEDNITKQRLTIMEQIPLLIATAVGGNSVSYWRTQTALGSSSAWAPFFILNNNDYNSIPEWVAASMYGVMAGYAATLQGLVEPTTNRISTNMISALIGSLTIATVKVVLDTIPRIQ